MSTDINGKGWDETADTLLPKTTKNCVIKYYSADGFYFFVRKGTSCAIDVTFMEEDDFRGGTETITLSADQVKEDSEATIGNPEYKVTETTSDYQQIDSLDTFVYVSLRDLERENRFKDYNQKLTYAGSQVSVNVDGTPLTESANTLLANTTKNCVIRIDEDNTIFYVKKAQAVLLM